MLRKSRSAKPQPTSPNNEHRQSSSNVQQTYTYQPQARPQRSNSYIPPNQNNAGRPMVYRASTHSSSTTSSSENNAMGDLPRQRPARPAGPSTSAPVSGGRPTNGQPRRLRSMSERYSNYGTMPPSRDMHVNAGANSNPLPPIVENEKMSISIDFGTTFSGVAYGSSRIAGGRVQQILQWPGSLENFRKIPTCLLYDEQGEVLAWGLEAKNAPPVPGIIRCEWFKLFLEPKCLRDGVMDPRLPKLPAGKKPVDAIADYLYHLWKYAKRQITREIGAVADLNSADVWLTVPAAWDAKGCDIMRDAAIKAELVRSEGAKSKDEGWKDRLRIITEPEAAAVHCAHLTNLHRLRPSQNFMICDAGGGTVDLAVYKILGSAERLEIAEVCARSGGNCGSLFLDLRFRDLVAKRLRRHPVHISPPSLATFQHAFSETDKLVFRGDEDDSMLFRFNCYNVEDPDDHAVGLINGELTIPGAVLRNEVFDPVIAEVLRLIENQIARCNQHIDALLLVGGFSGCEYLFKKVDQRFGSRIGIIARPADADTATCRGAARYGLANRPLVSSVVMPRSYIMKVKVPAESEDWQKRPGYIGQNNAGVSICTNRIQYLAHKGAVLRKGQRVYTKLCKFSQGPKDSMFVMMLYTSDSDRPMRYTDEGETTDLCKWTVDLSPLPSFTERARMGHQGGFYTDFELGLELDSAEVRGVLLYNGQEWCRAVFEFLN